MFGESSTVVLILMLVTNFLANVSISIVAPFLPKESELHGQSESTLGTMLGFQSLVEAFFSVIGWGYLASKFGLKNSTCAGLLLNGAGTILLGVLPLIPYHLPFLYSLVGFTIRAIQGLGTATAYNGSFAILAVVFAKDNSKVLSLCGTAGAVGVVCGPAMGSGFFKLGGFGMVFVANGAVSVLVSLLMLTLLPEIDQVEKDHVYSVPYRKVLSDMRTSVCLVMVVFMAAKWTVMDPILEPELRECFNFSEDQSALVFLLLSGTFILTTPAAGRFIGKPNCCDSLLVMMIGLVIALPAFLLAGPLPAFNIHRDLRLLMISLSVLGLANCLIYVPVQDIMFSIERLNLDPSTNTTDVTIFITSIWSCSYSIGYFLGMTSSGALSAVVGFSGAMTAYAGACGGLLVVLILVKVYELWRANRTKYLRGYSKLETAEAAAAAAGHHLSPEQFVPV